MRPFGLGTILLGSGVSIIAATRGIKKKSLSKSGATAAFMVAFLSIGSGLRGMVLLMFYQIGSSATKYKKVWKEAHDATAAEGSERGPSQVLGCSLVAVLLSLAHVYFCGEQVPIDFSAHPLASRLTLAILSHNATCLADTLASELGMLSTQAPVLITRPWKQVPPGTNGGITVWGTACSILGGALMGAGTLLMDKLDGLSPLRPFQVLSFGAITGLIGSLVDSLLGATLQATYQDPDTKVVHHQDRPGFKHIAGMNLLDNVQVNIGSIILTTFFGGWVLGPWMFQNKGGAS